uniref:Uncharacterized protein n=1 Tax=Romanomermis culicivorax TaxID=13658 RepID=A0A915IJL5_ROMCU
MHQNISSFVSFDFDIFLSGQRLAGFHFDQFLLLLALKTRVLEKINSLVCAACICCATNVGNFCSALVAFDALSSTGATAAGVEFITGVGGMTIDGGDGGGGGVENNCGITIAGGKTATGG